MRARSLKSNAKIDKSKDFKLKHEHKTALVKLASIFNDALPKHQKNNDLDTLITKPPRVNNKNVTENNYGEPRVAQNEPEQITESSAPTNPSQLTKQKQIHLRKTRNNTPIPNPPQSAPNNTSQR